MSKISTALKLLTSNPGLLWCAAAANRLLDWLPDRFYLEHAYKARTGEKLNLENPRGFNEKLQWMKLYDRKPEYTRMVDKVEVRSYIEEKIGGAYLIPLLGVWESADDICFSDLPDQFVLKCNHDSGSIEICRDKKEFDFEAAKKRLAAKMRTNTYWATREWPYKDVKPKIIAEQYMVDESGDELKDYKVLCFDGQPRLIELHKGRYKARHTINIYDTNWNLLNISQVGTPRSETEASCPENLEEMLRLSALLAEGIPHVRVDWYSVSGKLYFGELTFFQASGFDLFDDPKVEEELGSWITLPGRYSEE